MQSYFFESSHSTDFKKHTVDLRFCLVLFLDMIDILKTPQSRDFTANIIVNQWKSMKKVATKTQNT